MWRITDPALQAVGSSVKEVYAFSVAFRSGETFTFLCPSQQEKEAWFISVHVRFAFLFRLRSLQFLLRFSHPRPSLSPSHNEPQEQVMHLEKTHAVKRAQLEQLSSSTSNGTQRV
jgi:hypothetical protein